MNIKLNSNIYKGNIIPVSCEGLWRCVCSFSDVSQVHQSHTEIYISLSMALRCTCSFLRPSKLNSPFDWLQRVSIITFCVHHLCQLIHLFIYLFNILNLSLAEFYLGNHSFCLNTRIRQLQYYFRRFLHYKTISITFKV